MGKSDVTVRLSGSSAGVDGELGSELPRIGRVVMAPGWVYRESMWLKSDDESVDVTNDALLYLLRLTLAVCGAGLVLLGILVILSGH